LICRARNIANDPCQTLGIPTAPVGAASATAGIFNSATVYGYITYLTIWGESTPSTEIGPLNCANKAIDLSSMVPPLGATSARFYYGYASGAEQQFVAFTPGVAATVGLATDTPIASVAPYKSSAFLPDSDGDLVGAFEMYRWINAGLVKMGRLAGGILDQTGVAMSAGAAEVVIPGWWLSIKYIWHNGWLTLPEQQSYTWLQSPVQGIPGIATLWRNAAQQVMGTWPQPSTAPATTTLSAPLSAGATLASVVNANGFTAPGMCLIDNEIMSYSQSDTTLEQLTGMVRGYSGTVPVAHLAGATVKQLIFRLLGYRMPVQVSVGQSANTLDLPQGWDEVMDYYLLSRFKQTEQNVQEAATLMQEFEKNAVLLREDQIPSDSKQIGGLWPLGGAAETLADVMDTVIVT